MEHARRPKRYGKIDDALEIRAHNPRCGDDLNLYLKLDGDKLSFAFDGEACAIATASASILGECLVGKTSQEILELTRLFTEHFHTSGPFPEDLKEFEYLSRISSQPSRIPCVTLAWNTLQKGLEGMA